MASDPSFHSAIDRILSSLRGELEAPLRAYAEELQQASAAERARAVEQASEEIRRQAQEQLTQLRDTAKQQQEDLRRSAEVQIAELRKLLEDIRRNAQQQIDTARKTVETEVAAARRTADAEIEDARRIAQAQVEDVQRAADARLADFARERDAARGAAAAARQQAEGAAQRATEQAVRTVGALARDIVSLDGSSTLGDVLERLVHAAVRHCDRAALLTVKGARLREWRAIGIGGRTADQPVELGVEEAGFARLAITGARVATSDEDRLPPFASAGVVARAAAFPVRVAGSVVAVLYADVAGNRTHGDAWTASLDVLARHAGLVLESLTVQQATGARALAHASQRSSAAGAAAAEAAAHPSSGNAP